MLGWSGLAMAGANWLSKGAIHVLAHEARTCTENYPVIGGCADIVTTYPGNSVDAFPVFYDMVEYQRIDYALMWPGSQSCVFTSCSDHVAGTIVWPDDGVSHTWDVCHSGPVVIPGWAWIQDTGLIHLKPHPTIGGVYVYDCNGEPDNPCYNYAAGIGGYIGDDPCEPIDPSAAESDTWSSIKSLFAR
jgi:hypothetical protein